MDDEYDVPGSANRMMQFDNMTFMSDAMSNRSRPRTPSSLAGRKVSGSISSIDGHVQYADLRQQQNQINHIKQRSHPETTGYPMYSFDRPASSQSVPTAAPHMHFQISPTAQRMPNGNFRGRRFPYSPKTLQPSKTHFGSRQRSGSSPQAYYASSESDESHYTLPNDVKLEKMKAQRRLAVSDSDLDIDGVNEPARPCFTENYLEPNPVLQETNVRHSPVLYNSESKITYLTNKDLENINDEEEDAVDSGAESVNNDSDNVTYATTIQSMQQSKPGELSSPTGSGGIVSPSDKEVMDINFPDASNLSPKENNEHVKKNINKSIVRQQSKDNNQINLEKNSLFQTQMPNSFPDILNHGFHEEGEVIVI